jgi:large subunit ribosomal protein L29
MKPRKAKDLRELTDGELTGSLKETRETLINQRFQHSLSQLQDTAYLRTLKQDTARLKTIIKERNLDK